ncbi:MAG TPA: hypothetical protein PKY77_16585 [Phycisphaerae bacterium]|nr:hypothetical protein [Phycisphaerae bacterium]HRY70756.1 hypothetical protein [Phycisphaerae bacterium]HSA28872.1 hypothetical protein [Phycisphaerae bacterium]
MKTIQATVNPRLLTKASRLFTGTLQGRIIEILQNARRAGATQVDIANQDGFVIVRDNGQGIDDFAKLLDLGSSGWEEALEESEDPAGVGLFCLATRAVTIRSKGKRLTIADHGWTGEPVTLEDDPEPIDGTELRFRDEPWTSGAVDMNAVFTGMNVTVDGIACPRVSFVSDQATVYPELGCRIEVREPSDLNAWHTAHRRDFHYSDNALVNFHGQVVPFDCHPLSEHFLHFLIDMTGEPTGLRLMLPARTRLVDNEAFKKLQGAMELEAYRYLQKRGHHRLPFKEYLRARELGVALPEATPTYQAGLLNGDAPEPIEVRMPEGFPLAKCYRFDPDAKGRETDEANVHLLGALGKPGEPFVPVDIDAGYDGYSWAKLPTIDKVELQAGKVLQEDVIWSGRLVCVDSLAITVRTSDGRNWASSVCMAVRPVTGKQKRRWWNEEVLVTPEAQDRLNSTDLLYHLGGYSDEGDTWDTQDAQFCEQLERFWDRLVGPDESLRRRILEPFGGFDSWRDATVLPSGRITIRFTDGSKKTIDPPATPSIP